MLNNINLDRSLNFVEQIIDHKLSRISLSPWFLGIAKLALYVTITIMVKNTLLKQKFLACTIPLNAVMKFNITARSRSICTWTLIFWIFKRFLLKFSICCTSNIIKQILNNVNYRTIICNHWVFVYWGGWTFTSKWLSR